MLEAFPSGTITEGTPAAYAGVVEGCSLEAVRLACDDFASGRIEGRDKRWVPSGAEFAERVRLMDVAIARRDGTALPAEPLTVYRIGAEPPAGFVPLGPLEIDHGHGRIDMRRLSHADKEFVLDHKRLPSPAETKKLTVLPRLQRMQG